MQSGKVLILKGILYTLFSKSVRTGAGGLPKAYRCVHGGRGGLNFAYFERTYFMDGPLGQFSEKNSHFSTKFTKQSYSKVLYGCARSVRSMEACFKKYEERRKTIVEQFEMMWSNTLIR